MSSTWAAARIECLSLSADLASVSSNEENIFLTQLSGQDVWIGLNGFVPVKTGYPVWSDSTPVSFMSWLPGEPNRSSITVLQVASGGQGSWKSVSCFNSSFPYICQKGNYIEKAVCLCASLYFCWLRRLVDCMSCSWMDRRIDDILYDWMDRWLNGWIGKGLD